MSDSTKIKIAFERDPAGTRAIQNDLGALNALAEKLAKNFERVAKSIQSISGGGKVGGAQHIVAPGSNKGQGALLDGIFGKSDPGAAQRQAAGLTKALDDVIRKTDEAARKTTASGRRIRENIGLGGGTGGGSGPSLGGGDVGGSPALPGGGKPPSVPAPSSGLGSKWRENAAGAMIGGIGGSVFGGMGGTIGSIVGAMGGGSGPFGGMAKTFAPVMGGIGAGLAVASLMNKGAEAFEDLRGKQVGFTLNQPFAKLNTAASVAGFHANIYQQGSGGNIAYLASVNKTLNDRAIMGALGNSPLNKESLMLRFAESPLSLSSAGKQAINFIKSAAAGGFQAAGEWVTGSKLSDVEKKSALEILRTEGYQAMGGEQRAKFEQAVQNNMQFDPLWNKVANDKFGGAMSETRAMRMAGRSSGTFSGMNIVKYGPEAFIESTKDLPARSRLQAMRKMADDNNAQKSDRIYDYDKIRAKLTAQGRDEGDLGAGYQQMLGIGRGFGRYLNGIGDFISPGEAGLTNAAQLARAGGILGGSAKAGASFLRGSVQGSIGAGGIDVAAGRDMFGSMSTALIAQGNMGTGDTAAAYMRGMASVVGGGFGAPLDVGSQLRTMNQLGVGGQNLNDFTLGNKAPLYKATGLLGAIGAVGGYGAGAVALSKMSSEVIAGSMRSGEIPEGLASLGITPEQVRKYGMYQRKAPFFELRRDQFSGAAGTMIDEFRASGSDVVEFAKRKVGSATGVDKANILKNIQTTLGTALFSGGAASSMDAGAGTVASILGQDKGLYADLNGKGAYAPGPKGLAKTSLISQAEEQLMEGRKLGENEDYTSAEYKSRVARLEANLARAKQAEHIKDSGDLDAVATSFVHSAEALASAIKQAVKGLKLPVVAGAGK
jgi:hypothetical protein